MDWLKTDPFGVPLFCFDPHAMFDMFSGNLFCFKGTDLCRDDVYVLCLCL